MNKAKKVIRHTKSVAILNKFFNAHKNVVGMENIGNIYQILELAQNPNLPSELIHQIIELNINMANADLASHKNISREDLLFLATRALEGKKNALINHFLVQRVMLNNFCPDDTVIDLYIHFSDKHEDSYWLSNDCHDKCKSILAKGNLTDERKQKLMLLFFNKD